MAVLLAALSLPPFSALAWWACARNVTVPPELILARSFAEEGAGASDEASRAEPEQIEVASLLLPFGVRRADGTSAEAPLPAAEPADLLPQRPETLNAALRAAGSSCHVEARIPTPMRAAAGSTAERGPGSNSGAAARRQERRRCLTRRQEAPAAEAAAAPEGQYLGDAMGGAPSAPIPTSCQAGDFSARSRTRL
jgi:hypothetical protein